MIELIDYTQDPVRNIATAARGCFGNKKKDATHQEDLDLVKALIKQDHTPLEFAWVMFRITEISRACANQLNRYRITSQAQESMRYVDSSKKRFLMPRTCLVSEEECKHLVNYCFLLYEQLIEKGVPKEDARYFLPLGTETQLTIAFNFREFRHILKQRLDPHAQWEVRKIALEMYATAKEKWPWLVEDMDTEAIEALKDLMEKCK